MDADRERTPSEKRLAEAKLAEVHADLAADVGFRQRQELAEARKARSKQKSLNTVKSRNRKLVAENKALTTQNNALRENADAAIQKENFELRERLDSALSGLSRRYIRALSGTHPKEASRLGEIIAELKKQVATDKEELRRLRRGKTSSVQESGPPI